MSTLTRRRFLTMTGVVGAGALAVGATQVDWSALMTAAAENPSEAGALVVVTLYGGNDGLNTVVPAGDRAYQDLRPDLAYQPEDVLDLGDGLGLNPGMKGLKGLWDDGRLAIVNGVGYPKPDRSHFRSMAIWQTAAPETSVQTGWLGRWLDTQGGDPLRALSLDVTAPPMLAGEKGAGASLPVDGLVLPKGRIAPAFEALGAVSPDDDPWRSRAAAGIADLHRSVATFAPAVAAAEDADEDEESTRGASAGGASNLARQLTTVAELIEQSVPTTVYSVSLGGFDTHADERGTQERLLTQLDAALTPFMARLRGTPRGRETVVLVYSEFGRRPGANASDGTDHGTAGPVFVLGDRVSGGFHGQVPSLTDLVDDDLRPGVDFRDIYATLADKVLAADPAQVLGGHTGSLDALLSR